MPLKPIIEGTGMITPAEAIAMIEKMSQKATGSENPPEAATDAAVAQTGQGGTAPPSQPPDGSVGQSGVRGDSAAGEEKKDSPNARRTVGTKILISVICTVLAVAHVAWPNVKVDLATLALLIAAVVPWLGAVIRSIELPGGFKIELQDVKAATEKLATGTITANAAPIELARGSNMEFLRQVGDGDPNLSLVGLRIEIERRLSRLAELSEIAPGRRSAGAMLRDLIAREVIDRRTAAGLGDLIALGNQAAHGARVSRDAAAWALDATPLILERLDSLIHRRGQ